MRPFEPKLDHYDLILLSRLAIGANPDQVNGLTRYELEHWKDMHDERPISHDKVRKSIDKMYGFGLIKEIIHRKKDLRNTKYYDITVLGLFNWLSSLTVDDLRKFDHIMTRIERMIPEIASLWKNHEKITKELLIEVTIQSVKSISVLANEKRTEAYVTALIGVENISCNINSDHLRTHTIKQIQLNYDNIDKFLRELFVFTFVHNILFNSTLEYQFKTDKEIKEFFRLITTLDFLLYYKKYFDKLNYNLQLSVGRFNHIVEKRIKPSGLLD